MAEYDDPEELDQDTYNEIKNFTKEIVKDLIIKADFNDAYLRYKVRYEISQKMQSKCDELILSQCLVICDETNNSPLLIDMNGFDVKVFFSRSNIIEYGIHVENGFVTITESDKNAKFAVESKMTVSEFLRF